MTESRLATPWPLLRTDALIAIGVGVTQIVGNAALMRIAGRGQPMDLLGYVLLALSAVPLVFRNRNPVAVLVAVAAVAVVYTWLGYPGPSYTIALVFAIWAAVSAGRRLAALAIGAGLVANLAI